MRVTVQGIGEKPAEQLHSAKEENAHDIASFFLMSSDGLASYIWPRVAEPRADLLEVGATRYARENTAFSYQNCHTIDIGDRGAVMLHAFEIIADDTPETDPVLRPTLNLTIRDRSPSLVLLRRGPNTERAARIRRIA